MTTAREDPPLTQAHDPHPRKPRLPAIAGSCDTHAHVFGPGSRYPIVPNGLYTPADALLSDYRHMLDVLGVERAVLVQPSVYGTNNDALLGALAADPLRMRGVAVLPLDVEEAELERLHAAGVRGVRFNVVDVKSGKGAVDFQALRGFAARIAPLGWHVEFLMHVDEQPQLDLLLEDFPTPVCFGHLGYLVPPAKGIEIAGFRALLSLMQQGRAWVKLTAPYRLSALDHPYEDVQQIARALVEAAPERVLWGSDWPHVQPRPGGPSGAPLERPMPNDGDLFDVFNGWVPAANVRRRILVDNPAQLYGFAS